MKEKSLTLFAGIFLVLLSCFYSGCSSAPDMQIQAASQSVGEMDKLHATDYNIEEAKEAHNAWNVAQKLVAEKKYKESKPYLLKAKAMADLALRKVKTSRELKKRESESWVATVDNRFSSLKTDYQNRSAIFKPDQKQQMDEQIAKIDKAFIELKKDVADELYYKTADTGKKTMAMVNEGENLMKEITKKK